MNAIDRVVEIAAFCFMAPLLILALCGLYEDIEIESIHEEDVPAVKDVDDLGLLFDENEAMVA